MGSLIPNYEYDIFISYRQNDNKRDKWVTQFVEALRDELDATIKDSVSIYFDENPHDGLLETHDVDDSLKEKIKCLIFIPIVSRTYCDTKSFAWDSEFLPFLEFVKNDRLGLKVKLNNGNVASRILPVRIHDLAEEDENLFQKITGSILRGVDFIYSEAGVNRPLKITDSKNDNFYKTSYSNQLNKLANSISELVEAISKPPITEHTLDKPKDFEKTTHSSKKKNKYVFLLASMVLLFGVLLYFYLPSNEIKIRGEVDESYVKSIAVMPLIDLSPDKDQGWFSDGLSEEIINRLFNVKGLQVRGRNSSFAFQRQSLTIKQFADTLNVNYVVEGSVRKFGDDLRITVQLIRASDDMQIWSQQYDRDFKDIFKIQSDIANNLANSLNIYLDDKERKRMLELDARNPEAYEYFLKGKKIYNDVHDTNERFGLWEANEWFAKALELDSNMGVAWNYAADAYGHYSNGHMMAKEGMNITPSESIMKHRAYLKKAYERVENNEFLKKNFKLDYMSRDPNDWSGIRPIIDYIVANYGTNINIAMEEFMATFVYPIQGKETAINFLDAEIINDPIYTANVYFYKWIITSHSNDSIEAEQIVPYLMNTFRKDRLLILRYILSKDWDNLNSTLNTESNDFNLFEWWNATLQPGYKPDSIPGLPSKDIVSHSLMIANYHWQNGNASLADAIMYKLDNNPDVDYFMLLTGLATRFQFHTPFNIAAMPNFNERLHEVGIDPSFFKPFPVIKGQFQEWKMNQN